MNLLMVPQYSLSLPTAVCSIGGGIPLLCLHLNVLCVVSLSFVVQKLFSQLSVLLQEELLYKWI